MPVFISYSHKDKDFVNKFAAHLVQNRTWVWVDRWEINVGDSLLNKVQSAIQGASALIVVLSKASVASSWCNKELNAGLIRELDEKRVVVLPALIEDCEIPVFLKEKMYADFRTNFDDGLRATLEAIAKITSDTTGRIELAKSHGDWAVDWLHQNGHFVFRWTVVEHAVDYPYSIITEIQITPNDAGNKRYKQYADAGLDWMGRFVIVECVADAVTKIPADLLIEDSLPVTTNFTIMDKRMGIAFDIRVSARRLGEDTGKNTLIHWGAHIANIRNQLKNALRPLTSEESMRLAHLVTDGFTPALVDRLRTEMIKHNPGMKAEPRKLPPKYRPNKRRPRAKK